MPAGSFRAYLQKSGKSTVDIEAELDDLKKANPTDDTVTITDGKIGKTQVPAPTGCLKCGLYVRYRGGDFICDSCNALAAADAVIATSDVQNGGKP